ncbi:Hypothetical_protein [Hexamita inflata]|uniref:Hypothetical_protein n=1 Tax=Hexamita inflata TaxID=28002 RepID=A0AA86R569_9EUKA|nr:Hypothetical protein HINF_LOCUS58415 [Hexamita inflata]
MLQLILSFQQNEIESFGGSTIGFGAAIILIVLGAFFYSSLKDLCCQNNDDNDDDYGDEAEDELVHEYTEQRQAYQHENRNRRVGRLTPVNMRERQVGAIL